MTVKHDVSVITYYVLINIHIGIVTDELIIFLILRNFFYYSFFLFFAETLGYFSEPSTNNTCIRQGLLTAVSALGSIVLCFLSLALTVMCYRAKSLNHCQHSHLSPLQARCSE